MHLFYLQSVQPEIFLSLWRNRLIIKPKTLFFHHLYVNIKLASEKGRHTHIYNVLLKTRGFQSSRMPSGALHTEKHAYTLSHCTSLLCEERFREEGQVHREIPARQQITPSSSTFQRQEKLNLWNECGAHLQHGVSFCSLNDCKMKGVT